jgi:hypothetical protein
MLSFVIRLSEIADAHPTWCIESSDCFRYLVELGDTSNGAKPVNDEI